MRFLGGGGIPVGGGGGMRHIAGGGRGVMQHGVGGGGGGFVPRGEMQTGLYFFFHSFKFLSFLSNSKFFISKFISLSK